MRTGQCKRRRGCGCALPTCAAAAAGNSGAFQGCPSLTSTQKTVPNSSGGRPATAASSCAWGSSAAVLPSSDASAEAAAAWYASLSEREVPQSMSSPSCWSAAWVAASSGTPSASRPVGGAGGGGAISGGPLRPEAACRASGVATSAAPTASSAAPRASRQLGLQARACKRLAGGSGSDRGRNRFRRCGSKSARPSAPRSPSSCFGVVSVPCAGRQGQVKTRALPPATARRPREVLSPAA